MKSKKMTEEQKINIPPNPKYSHLTKKEIIMLNKKVMIN